MAFEVISNASFAQDQTCKAESSSAHVLLMSLPFIDEDLPFSDLFSGIWALKVEDFAGHKLIHCTNQVCG